jgi:hypothetical protein
VSGDNTEHAHTLASASEREKRDAAIRAKLADPKSLHAEAVAEAELCIQYCESPVVFGDPNERLTAGFRLPDTIEVLDAGGNKAKLHAFGQRAGHTLILLGSSSTTDQALTALHANLTQFTGAGSLFESAFAFAANAARGDAPAGAAVGRLNGDATELLGIDGITLLAIRPDGYLGLRADRDHLATLDRYSRVVKSGRKIGPPDAQNFAQHAS